MQEIAASPCRDTRPDIPGSAASTDFAGTVGSVPPAVVFFRFAVPGPGGPAPRFFSGLGLRCRLSFRKCFKCFRSTRMLWKKPPRAIFAWLTWPGKRSHPGHLPIFDGSVYRPFPWCPCPEPQPASAHMGQQAPSPPLPQAAPSPIIGQDPPDFMGQLSFILARHSSRLFFDLRHFTIS